MRKMTLSEIHSETLKVLCHIHEFCMPRGIRYGLTYGTLLGAVRHHGFIPWDDDADIMMPIDDYKRFVGEYVDSGDFKLYAPERGNSWLLYGRICEVKRTYFGQVLPWTKERPGIGVDIFPYENADDDKEKHLQGLTRLKKIRIETFRARERRLFFRYLSQISSGESFRSNCANFARQLVYAPRLFANRLHADRFCDEIVKKYLDNVADITASESSHCGDFRCLTYLRKEWLDSSWFESFDECGFEGKRLMIPREYDNILKNYYGDYMVLPPESEREDHSKVQTMYWRNK